MTVFSLRGSTALIALSVSLSLALPGMLVAQDSQPGAVAPEAAWQPITRLGLAFEVPPGATVTDESDTEGARYFAVSTMGADGIGARLGMRFLTADEMAEVPAPGTPEFAAYLGDLGSVPVSATGTVMDLGGRQMLVYAGTGSVAGPGGVQHEGRMLYLVSQSAEADGSTLLIAVFSAGVGGGVAGELEARFVTSLRPAEARPEVETDAAPEDGASDTPDAAPPASAAEVATAGDPAPADAAAAQVADAGAAGTAPEPAAPVAADAPATPPAEPAAEVAAAPEPEPEPVAVPAANDVEILAGLAGIDLPEGMVVADAQRGDLSTDLYLAEAASPDTRRLLISAGMLTRGLYGQVDRMLHRIDALVETEVGGQPVWVVHGVATRNLDGRSAGVDEAVPAQLVAPRFCVDGVPPYLVGILGAPGDAARIDTLLASLQLALPETAVPCGDGPAVEIRAAMDAQAPVAAAEPIAPVIPEGWEAHSRFGLSFAAPAGMVVRRERAEPDRLEYWLQLPDSEGSVTREISLRVFNPEARARLPHALPDEDGFAAMLTDFADLPIVATDERVVLGGQSLRVFRGAGTRTVAGAEFASRVLYLIAEAPDAQGLTPWIALQGIDHSPEAEAGFEAAFIASLGGQAALPAPEPAEPQPEASPPPAIVMPPPPVTAVTPEPPARPAATPEALAWQAAAASGTPEAVLAYLGQYPRGLHSGEARAWLYARDIVPPDERRAGPVEPPAAPARVEADDWQRTLAENRVEAYWTYLKHWPDGTHGAEARLMLGRLLYVAPPAPEPAPPATK